MNFSFWLNQQEFSLSLEEKETNIFDVFLGGKKSAVTVEFLSPEELLLNIDGKIYNVIVHSNTRGYSVFVNGKLFKLEKKSAWIWLKSEKERLKKREIKIPMPGRVVELLAREGDEVKAGQAILVLEAMKMQNEIKSPQPGKVTRLNVKAGDYVEAGSVLFSVE